MNGREARLFAGLSVVLEGLLLLAQPPTVQVAGGLLGGEADVIQFVYERTVYACDPSAIAVHGCAELIGVASSHTHERSVRNRDRLRVARNHLHVAETALHQIRAVCLLSDAKVWSVATEARARCALHIASSIDLTHAVSRCDE